MPWLYFSVFLSLKFMMYRCISLHARSHSAHHRSCSCCSSWRCRRGLQHRSWNLGRMPHCPCTGAHKSAVSGHDEFQELQGSQGAHFGFWWRPLFPKSSVLAHFVDRNLRGCYGRVFERVGDIDGEWVHWQFWWYCDLQVIVLNLCLACFKPSLAIIP